MRIATEIVAAGVVAAVAVRASLWALRVTRVAALVGDEFEYAAIVERRPGPAPFHRMPAHGWLLRRVRRVDHARRITALASVASTAAATAVAAQVAGGWAGLAAGLLVAFCSERLLLGARLWPDPLMAVGYGVLVAACVPSTGVHWGVGAAACVVMTSLRVDGLLTGVLAAAVLPIAPIGRLVVLGAAALPLLLVAVARRVRGRSAPIETTSWFNIRLSAAQLSPLGRMPLESAIGELSTRWHGENDLERRAAARSAATLHWRHPLRWALGVGGRIIGLCAADSFSAQRVLPSYDPPLRRWVAALTTSLGAAIVVLAAAGAGGGTAPRVAALVGLQVLGLSMFHTRTRFRATLLPGLVVLAAAGIHQLCAANVGAIVAGATTMALGALATRLDVPEHGR